MYRYKEFMKAMSQENDLTRQLIASIAEYFIDAINAEDVEPTARKWLEKYGPA